MFVVRWLLFVVCGLMFVVCRGVFRFVCCWLVIACGLLFVVVAGRLFFEVVDCCSVFVFVLLLLDYCFLMTVSCLFLSFVMC